MEKFRKEIREELGRRTSQLVISLDQEFECKPGDYIGKFPLESDYDRVIREDCDVFVGGRKVVSFRKALLPHLKDGSDRNPEVWGFIRKASREVYGTQRGMVAGSEMTTKPESRLTKGQVAFLVQSSSGLITTLEQAREVLESSDEYTVKTLKIKYVKKAYPEIAEAMRPIENLLKGRKLPLNDDEKLRSERRKILWSWFDPWLENVWLPSNDKVTLTKELIDNLISTQMNFNHCYSNVLGAIDRGSRFPFGRLSGTTERHYDDFEKYQGIYASACEALKVGFPEEWKGIQKTISRVKDPVYSLFGTAFTSITLNFNFRTAYHLDKNNLKGGMAVLSVITKGQYDGHYLVFPQLRLAFDLRDGDFIAADTQSLLHGNTPMRKISEDAERVSLVFYSRENMIYLDDMECEKCRRKFVKFSASNLPEKGKAHRDWNGVWPEMWISQEWLDYRKSNGLEHCTNSNWRASSPYENEETGEVKLFKTCPEKGWRHLEVTTFVK